MSHCDVDDVMLSATGEFPFVSKSQAVVDEVKPRRISLKYAETLKNENVVNKSNQAKYQTPMVSLLV